MFLVFLGDIDNKRFRSMMLPFRGLSVCLSLSCIMLKRQKISTRFLLLTPHVSPRSC